MHHTVLYANQYGSHTTPLTVAICRDKCTSKCDKSSMGWIVEASCSQRYLLETILLVFCSLLLDLKRDETDFTVDHFRVKQSSLFRNSMISFSDVAFDDSFNFFAY